MDILNIFYNHVIKEALTGRVDCYFYYNIVFNVIIEDKMLSSNLEEVYEDVIIPTLNIQNKEEFDRLLIIYVNKCLEFYDNSNFHEEILNGTLYDEENKICKEKKILTLLFANASLNDFANPIFYLNRRINFLDSLTCNYDLGYSDILNCNLAISVTKDKINNETPYQFVVTLISLDGSTFELPRIKFAVSENKAYIYAIQNYNKTNSSFYKKTNRKFYKVNEGFNKDEDNNEIYGDGNLNDVSSSFLLVANMLITYLITQNVNEFYVCPFLIERWNSKVIANHIKEKYKNVDYNELYKFQLNIQSNLTEKFLRTFLRLNYHCDNLEIKEYPMEQDSNLHIVSNNEVYSNNPLLNEVSYLIIKRLKTNNLKK